VHGTFGVAEHALSDGAGVHQDHPRLRIVAATYLGVSWHDRYDRLLRAARRWSPSTRRDRVVSGARVQSAQTVGQMQKSTERA